MMIEYRLTLAGCDCAVAEWNPSGSILVFALHGWLDNLASFESLVLHMPEIRLIAVDFPGHGHSKHIGVGFAYHFIDGLYLIDDLANHFKVKHINLLGHSMGGAVSSLYAASQHDRVKGLVLVESLGPLTIEPEQAISLINKAIKQRALLKDKSKPIYSSFEQALNARAAASQINKELIKPIVERGLTSVNNGYTWRADPRLRTSSPIRISEDSLQQILSNIKSPVLLIEGDSGLFKDSQELQARKQHFKQLLVCVLQGGHHVHLEEPAKTGYEIQSFFQKIR
jgi:pimeloyl-ACP methyl ester carboxylesterase